MGRRKKYWLAALAMLMTMALVTCSFTEKNEVDTKQKEPITLEVYAWSDEATNVGILADAYMEQNPEIKIHANIIPIAEFGQRMLSLKNGTGQADCIFSPSPAEAIIWQNKGMLKNLDKYLKGLDLEDHYEQWYEEGMEKSASYMIPYRKSRWAVYYNKTLFEKMGVAYPEKGWTWHDYEDIAVQLTGWVDGKCTYGSLSFEPSSTWWRVPARTAGANNPFVKPDLQKFRESAEWIYHLTYDLGAQMPYSRQNGSNYDYDGAFLEGNIGMYFSGDWSATVLNRAIKKTGISFDYDIAPLPSWKGEETYILSDAAVISMLDTTEHPDETFDFMHFVAGKEGAAVLAEHQVIPAWEGQKIKEVYQESTEVPEHTEYFFLEGKISMVPASVRYSEGMEIMKNEVALYLLQEQDIDQTFQNIEKRLDELW